MSASICPKCGGWHGEQNDDGDWSCTVCGFTLYRAPPLGKPVPRAPDKSRSAYDKPEGVKPIGKGPGSLAR